MLTRVIKILALAAMAVGSFGSSAGAQEKQAIKLENARLVYEEMIDEREGGVPPSLRADAKCVAVIPHVVKGGFLVGGRHGNGVMSCRNDAGVWSPPVFIEIKGVSLGLQVGGQASDLVLFFMSEEAARSLMTSKFTLGGDASVAAGPVGRETQPNSDPNVKAESTPTPELGDCSPESHFKEVIWLPIRRLSRATTANVSSRRRSSSSTESPETLPKPGPSRSRCPETLKGARA